MAVKRFVHSYRLTKTYKQDFGRFCNLFSTKSGECYSGYTHTIRCSISAVQMFEEMLDWYFAHAFICFRHRKPPTISKMA